MLDYEALPQGFGIHRTPGDEKNCFLECLWRWPPGWVVLYCSSVIHKMGCSDILCSMRITVVIQQYECSSPFYLLCVGSEVLLQGVYR